MQLSLLIFNINQFIFYLCTVNIDFEYHKYFEYLENDTLWVWKRKNWNCVLSISLYDIYSYYLSHYYFIEWYDLIFQINNLRDMMTLLLMKRKYTKLLFSLLFSFFIIFVLDFHCIFFIALTCEHLNLKQTRIMLPRWHGWL